MYIIKKYGIRSVMGLCTRTPSAVIDIYMYVRDDSSGKMFLCKLVSRRGMLACKFQEARPVRRMNALTWYCNTGLFSGKSLVLARGYLL